MCAIFGIIGTYETKEARKAFGTLAHRGIDASVTSADEKSFLGVHRLAVTGIAQPFTKIPLQKGIRI
ncbi:MAG TPA: hypothetical protein VLL31_03100, partial [Sulfurovum sp.]|nr:hypothetical protein [Sulfurovum sp.]